MSYQVTQGSGTPIDSVVAPSGHRQVIVPVVTPDAGVTQYPLQGNTLGQLTVNANSLASNALFGASMTYQEYIARGLAPGTNRKVLKATAAITTSATPITVNSFTDQSGNAYTSVTTGKTFYVSKIIVSLGLLTSTTYNNTSLLVGDGSNQPISAQINSTAPLQLAVDGLESIGSGGVLTAIFGQGLGSSTAAITVIGWEE